MLHFKFKLFGHTVGVRVDCKGPRYPSREVANISRGDVFTKELGWQVVDCNFCGGFHLLKNEVPARQKVINRQQGKCLHCGELFGNELTMHHVVPKRDGGKSENGNNLVGLCRICHDAVEGMHSKRLKRRRVKEYLNRRKCATPSNPIIRDKMIAAGIIAKPDQDQVCITKSPLST